MRRLIPAHAGKTLRGRGRRRWRRAHPRSRGENAACEGGVSAGSGSSPLTRGKRTLRVTAGILRRLIPAHAGKTESLCFRSFFLSAHPRSRGENGYPVSVQAQLLGSSPLTRGKRRVAPGVAQDRGLIPAHAGKTKAAQQMVVNFQAHPRSRGENENCSVLAVLTPGSSPLTRGKHEPRSPPGCCPGLIPAHAGKTDLALVSIDAREAHPRSRGENAVKALVNQPGSVDATDAGLIPAHAGKTSQR